MPSVDLRRSAQVVLDGSGNGSIRIAPVARDWVVKYIAVNVSTNNKEAFATVYSDNVGDYYVIDSTFTGSSGDTSDTVNNVRDGHCLWIVWEGGDPGATATVVYSGEENW